MATGLLPSTLAIWTICAAATLGVILRPLRWPEAVWAVAGAALLLACRLIAPGDALGAAARGTDVYLFVIGMMLLSETAREQGVFDWVAAHAVNGARGSPLRLLVLVYGAGIVITTFLSNDATAVVLTPAVYAAARKARAEPLPLLFACAMIANAASFVLPIANPANLVLYGGHMPALGRWFASFAWPSLAAILVTFAMLCWAERKRLAGACAPRVECPPLSTGGKSALAGIAATAAVLLVVSALDRPLGLATCLAGLATTLGVCALARRSPLALARSVSWSVLPLVAGLFVLVEAVDRTGLIAVLAHALRGSSDPARTAALSGTALALAANAINNLPAGLIAATAVIQAQPPRIVTDALLIGVDLGPNLSITGSLATILWLQAIRREGQDVGFWRFLQVGVLTMIPALLAALWVRLLIG